MSPETPGQYRRGFLVSQILHFMEYREPVYPYRIIGLMARMDLFLKIELEVGDDERPQKLATEISRQLEKVYGVRRVEVQNLVTDPE